MLSQYVVELGQDYWETAKATLPIILKLLLGHLQYQLLGNDYWGTAGDGLGLNLFGCCNHYACCYIVVSLNLGALQFFILLCRYEDEPPEPEIEVQIHCYCSIRLL